MTTKVFFTLGLFFCLFSNASEKRDSIPAKENDVKSIDAIVHALYDVISGDSGVQRNWDRMRTLFLPEGRLISCGMRQNGKFGYRVMSVEDYISINGPFLEKSGFFEDELSNSKEEFGHIAHVFSTYQTKKKQTDKKPFARGINSIQLMFDGKRWWIVSVYWTGETPANIIPSRYLD